MTNYAGISSTLFDEPEYRSPEDIVVATYIMTNRDMAGVCPMHPGTVAAACRISTRKLSTVLNYFESLGKLIFGKERTHIWWKSGIFHSLYKGKCSETQKKSVETVVKRWDYAKIFDLFAVKVHTHYENKYGIDLQVIVSQQPDAIPPPPQKPTPSDTLSVLSQPQSQSQTETVSDNAATDSPTRADPELGGKIQLVLDELQFQSGDWQICLANMTSRCTWVNTLIADFGVDKVLQAVKSIREYYTSRGIPAPADPATAREKFYRWCKTQRESKAELDETKFWEEQNG